MDFQNKKISLNSNNKYSYINIYWEDFNSNKNNERLDIKSNDVTFNELRIADSVDFNNVLQEAKLVQVDAGNDKLGSLLSIHFLVDTLKSNKIDFKRIIE